MTFSLCLQDYFYSKIRVWFIFLCRSNLGEIRKNYISITVHCCLLVEAAICFPLLKCLFSLWQREYLEIYYICICSMHISLPLGRNLVSMEECGIWLKASEPGSFPAVAVHGSAWSKSFQLWIMDLPWQPETSCWLMSLKQPVKTVTTN